MQYIKLGNSDLELSKITYGSWAIGGWMWGGNEKKDSLDAIAASLDYGVSTIDTAPIYGFGASEELIAEVIKGKDRSKIQILSKFGLVWDGSNQKKGIYYFKTEGDDKKYSLYKYAAKENIIKEVEESLKRLKTDYIDLYQIHWPDSSTPISETMETLKDLIAQGKIRAAGVCNYSLEETKEAKKHLDIVSNQVSYSMLDKEIEKELTPFCIKENIGIIAYSPMARGLLSGKYFEGEKLKKEDHRNAYFDKFDLLKVEDFLKKMTPLAKDKKASLSQLVLRWTTLQEGISVVLAGARNANQAIQNAKSMEIDLYEEELQFINTELSKI